MGKHTPGPWFAEGKEVYNSRDIGGVWVAETLVHNLATAKADARLIAAAPELLEALERARTFMVNRYATPIELSTIDAALAKARGE